MTDVIKLFYPFCTSLSEEISNKRSLRFALEITKLIMNLLDQSLNRSGSQEFFESHESENEQTFELVDSVHLPNLRLPLIYTRFVCVLVRPRDIT